MFKNVQNNYNTVLISCIFAVCWIFAQFCCDIAQCNNRCFVVVEI